MPMEIALALIGFTCFFSMWVVLPRFLMIRKNPEVKELCDLEQPIDLDQLNIAELSSQEGESDSLSLPTDLTGSPVPPN